MRRNAGTRQTARAAARGAQRTGRRLAGLPLARQNRTRAPNVVRHGWFWALVALTGRTPSRISPPTSSADGPDEMRAVHALRQFGPVSGLESWLRRRFGREADLPTEQARAQAPAWVSRAHGDQGRPEGDRQPPRPRTQAPQRLILLPGRPGHGAAAASERFSGGGSRRTRPGGCLRPADATARRRRARACRIDRFPQGRHRCGAQPRTAALEGNGAARRSPQHDAGM